MFQSGKIAEQLDFVNHNIRTKLDEIKRRELDRLRHLATKVIYLLLVNLIFLTKIFESQIIVIILTQYMCIQHKIMLLL